MSIETAYQKLRKLEHVSFWKILLCSLLPAAFSALIVPISPQNAAVGYTFVKILILLSFTAAYLACIGGGLAAGIGLCWILMRSKESFHYKHGIIIGNSLATNHNFLLRLARGLYPHIIGFIRGYNDPRFEELETKINTNEENHNKERKEWEVKEKIYLNKNASLIRQLADEKWKNAQLEKFKQEQEQIQLEKTLTQNNKDQKPIDFKDTDEK